MSRKINPAKCADTGSLTPGDPQYPYSGKYVKDLTFAQVRTLDGAQLPAGRRRERLGLPALRHRGDGAARARERHPVIPWTINDPATMHKLIDDGVDGNITDYPNRLRQVMAARGMKLPRPYPKP